ncbi:RHS repeat-associated core domain-containing protein [Streptomyces sp. M92]|uniref:RHS repeat-associated core domain-containing protein n=1 Tax=Streptomyces sp. M92 TaxID=2944250 RepID=UPI00234A9533|nr:RHS repeat-associated core domain-containing protein [Streptomyces sp. M92]WCN07362.1 RHS repeat-associated core domain-containing protein [Streptomyces sp. M92]
MDIGIGTTKRRDRHRGRGATVAAVLALALAVPTGLAPVAAQAAEGGLGRPDLPGQRVSKVKETEGPGARKARAKVAQGEKADAERARRSKDEQRAAAWPKQGDAIVELRAGKRGRAKPGGLPVTVSPSGGKNSAASGTEARIHVLGQQAAEKAGITGVLLTAEADEAGQAQLSIDYSSFASAVGGDWADRLHLVRLPGCVLDTPDKAACRTTTPVTSDNDRAQQTLTAAVQLSETDTGPSTQLARAAASTQTAVFAVTAASPGAGASPSGAGDYSATDLSESSSWEAGDNSGSFTWNYDISMPPAAAGPTPELALSYDSGSVDGRTAATNNQGSAVGEGFSLTESYIERSYGSCDDDGHDKANDRCWKYDNAQLVLNGKATRLVKKSGDAESTWRLANDDASTVTRSTGADNGDDNGEYWTVVTGDGTRYVFGKNKLDGAGSQRTNSTWTVPVFGDDSGEPGYSSGDSFGDRAVTQAWRWNLDYVEDTHGNASTYWYAKETNHYKKNKAATANASYTRGGYLKEIKYGLRKGALFTDDADAKVTFSHAERCTASDCSSLTKDTAKNWPDVPFDAICTDGDDDCLGTGPSFFSRKRLTGIDTFSYNAAGGDYDPVDSWDFTQEYLDGGDIGDTSDHVLTLKSIKRTGKAGGTAIPLAPVSFTYQWRENRVDGTDDILPLTRPRIATVTSETGSITTVTLSSPECTRSEVQGAAEDVNTRSCFPQYWNVNGAEDASVDWFHKYRVEAVVVSDPAGNNDAVEYAYDYSGAAWHHSDNPFTPKDERTWSDWRGYRQVTVHTGAKETTRSKTVSLYMQGMHGDKQKDGTTRSVSVTPLASPSVGVASITDSDQFQGIRREHVTYNGSTPITVEVTDPWSKETARQSAPGAADHVARYVRTAKSTTYEYLSAADAWRSRSLATSYDDYGMPVTVGDSGEIGKGGDETCTRTWYARNDAAGINDLVSRTRTIGRSCSIIDTSLNLPANSQTRGDVLSDTATVYDNPDATTWSASQKPTKGVATWTGRATGYNATAGPDKLRAASGWQTTSTTAYDVLGRPVGVTDADGNTTHTRYTPATAGPLTKTTVTNPKGHVTDTYIDPRHGQAVRVYDANAKKTESTYDALGRLTAVWLPNRSKAGGYSANTTFKYHLGSSSPSWVSTSTLKKDGKTYSTSYELYDAMMRPLQTQTPSPLGGRVLTDTRYDTRGLAYEKYEDIFDTTSAPNGTYTRAEYGEAPTQTETVYDGAERPTTSTLYVYGVKKWSTTTSYTGDSTATTALKGGSASRTLIDARGRTVETREYAGTSPADPQFGGGTGTASYTSSTFQYTLDDLKTRVTGPDGARWTYGYDLFGRKISADDPDKGLTRLSYDQLDRLTQTTDSRGKSVITAYDALDRITGTWAGSKTDAGQLTAFTYDALLEGQPDTSTRYVGGKNGTAYTKTVTAYDKLYRPTTTELTLPGSDPLVAAGAPTTLQFEGHYNIDGTLQSTKEPALGGLPSEVVGYQYTATGQVTSIVGKTGYLLDADYSALGQARQLTLGTADTEEHKKAYVTNLWEEGTKRLLGSHVTDQTHPYKLQNLAYTYDQTGNVTSIADTSTLGGTAAAETQCFAYDGHRRMTGAWTPASQKCSDTRSAHSLGGRAPYWTSYTYNDAGQRTTQTEHAAGGNTTTNYCYEKEGQPHALTGTSTTADCTSPDRAFTFDSTGNTTSRPDGTATQDLAWSEEGKLTSLTEDGKTTDYLYGADGTLLVRDTEDGERILYAGATELHLRADGTAWAQRRYGSGDVTVAVRSNESGSNELSYLVNDPHGTATLAIDATDQAYSRRYMTPFGAPRGTATGSAWPDDKGFLGKTTDTGTGLTHVGARQYDPEIGQFISVDPLLQTGIGQTLNGYSYAVQNPQTVADPTGLGVPGCHTGEIKNCRNGVPVSSGKKASSGSEGPVRACRCGKRPPLVKGMKPTGLGGIPGRRNITLPSTPAPKGWLRTVPSTSGGSPAPNPGPKPKPEANKNWFGKVLDVIGVGTEPNTWGACISVSGGAVLMGTLGGCVMVSRNADGDWDLGVSGSPAISGVGGGLSADLTGLTSNADSLDQLRGWGWDKEVSAHYGIGGLASHESSFNLDGSWVRNSKGEPVWATEVGGGPGVEGGVETGLNYTWGCSLRLGCS